MPKPTRKLLKPQGLLDEIRVAEDEREAYLKTRADRWKRIRGPYFRTDMGRDPQDTDPENVGYSFLSYMMPRTVFNNPRVRCTSRRAGSHSKYAKAMQFGLNRWIADFNLVEMLRRQFVDYATNYCVSVVTEERRPGQPSGATEPFYWPVWRGLELEHFLWDPAASLYIPPRFTGHLCSMDREALIDWAEEHEDEGWSLEVIKGLSVDADLEKLHRPTRNLPKRDEILWYEVHVRDHELEDSDGPESGFNGTILTIPVQATIPDNEDASWLRKPRPYYGPRQGPYVVGGYMPVAGECVSLAPLLAIESEARALNAHVRANQRAADRRKQIGIGDAVSENEVQKINNAKDGDAVIIRGYNRQTFDMYNFGGVTAEGATHEQMQRDRVQRNLGFSESRSSGSPKGGATATAEILADQGSNSREAGFVQGFHNYVKTGLRDHVAHFLHYGEHVIFPLDDEAAEEFEMAEPWFQGGIHGDASGATLQDMELEIDPYSMPDSSEARMQQGFMFKLAAIGQVFQLAMAAPGALDVEETIDELGEVTNDPNLSRLVDADALEEAGIAARDAAQAPPGGSEPMFGRELGAVGVAQRMPTINVGGGAKNGQSAPAMKLGASPKPAKQKAGAA